MHLLFLILLTEENKKIVVAIYKDMYWRQNQNSASLVDYDIIIPISKDDFSKDIEPSLFHYEVVVARCIQTTAHWT